MSSAATSTTAAAAAATTLSSSPSKKPSFSPSKSALHFYRTTTATTQFKFTLHAKNPISDVIKSSPEPPKSSILDDFYDDDEKPREECGVVGIYGDPEASRLCYLALHALQRRGQEGAGIVAATPAVRDPFGFRPLVMGRRSNGSVVFASETCALDLIEATYQREVNLGEVLVVDKDGVQSMCLMPHPEPKSCIFEHIYFALLNSVVFGMSVYESRRRFGEILATEAAVDCDVVIVVSDSGVVAALGYAAKAGVSFQQGLIVTLRGRTFIEPLGILV